MSRIGKRKHTDKLRQLYLGWLVGGGGMKGDSLSERQSSLEMVIRILLCSLPYLIQIHLGSCYKKKKSPQAFNKKDKNFQVWLFLSCNRLTGNFPLCVYLKGWAALLLSILVALSVVSLLQSGLIWPGHSHYHPSGAQLMSREDQVSHTNTPLIWIIILPRKREEGVVSREKVCLTLFLFSAEGWEGSHQSKRPGRAQLPTSGRGALAPLRPILGGLGKKREGGVRKERWRALSPPTGLSSCAWLSPHRPHPPLPTEGVKE